MTDNVRGSLGPPWSVDLLADLHAGALDLDESERLWPQVNADPDARAVIEALDSVRGDLGDLSTAPVEPMPAQFAAGLDAALAAEAQRHFARPQAPVATAPPAPPTPPPAPVIDLAAARKRRNRMAAWGAGVLTAAAAAIAVAVVAVPSNSTDGSGIAGDAPKSTQQDSEGASAAPPLALSSDNLNQAIPLLGGKTDYGDLQDEAGLRACLDQNEIPSAGVAGVSPVTFDGTEAVAALFGAGETGQAGKFRLVVLTADCEVLAQSQLPS
ncbi:hypothetical protein BLA60_32015 [Actinophytocola xinjiangensis]|uniref:Anti-sigma-M factor RsmA n=1 Tax=Actinophytocola xinjiangensis TaxID=485602 RepID=A0A7Z1AUN3_9PSEU|nr:hypothetical protein [Actinophytocola xinjiangensis]OLF06279.1 hypothetical protein BLA60_32015 [Actinophytocola xinjiangensis]